MFFVEESLELSGRILKLQTGKYAIQADASVFASFGDTCVLVTIAVGQERTDVNYVPLTVEYAEKLYAGGIIKGSRWVKREGAPSDEAILVGRLIDRGIRPSIPKSFRRDTQVIVTLLSIDGINAPDIVASIAVSAALGISSVPIDFSVATCRIGHISTSKDIENAFIAFPTEKEMDISDLDLVVTSSEDRVLMLEAKAQDLSERIIEEGILFAKKQNKKLLDFIASFCNKVNRAKPIFAPKEIDKSLINGLKKNYEKEIITILEKTSRKDFDTEILLSELINEIYDSNNQSYDKTLISNAIDFVMKEYIRKIALEKNIRIDGRKLDEIRELIIETSILPRTHGSALFQRGQTQVLSIATLGSPRLEQLIEGPEGKEAKRYIHHYYMPPYATGETGKIGIPSRREKGHGALAEKALEPVLPSQEVFPYVIRVVSEVTSSNGSTSMASTCGSTLALMDAGVPILKPVAGISIGMISESDTSFELLTDILGVEDHYGDMDFKVAGTEDGITAIQLDVKCKGLTDSMIHQAFEKARKARIFILEKMKSVIAYPRKEISQYAPKVVVLNPPEDKIGEIIGPGGKNIRHIIAETGAEVDILDDGRVNVSGISKEAVEKAVEFIENIYREVKEGEIFDGEVKRILPFGAIVEFMPGKEGLVHISNLGKGYIKSVENVVLPGDKVQVKILRIDERGKTDLTLLKNYSRKYRRSF